MNVPVVMTTPDGSMDAHADAAADASDTPTPQAVSLLIDPATVTLLVQGGSTATQAFHTSARYPDGSDRPVLDATWTVDDTHAGTIDSHGVFTANGTRAGVVHVSADATVDGNAMHATAVLTIRTHFDVLGSLPATTPAHFAGDGIMDARSPSIVYPLDRAIMPGNVPAPDVQWDLGSSVGQMDDIYRVHIERPSVVIDGYVRNIGTGFTYDWLVDSVAWQALVSADAGQSVQITVDRWDSVANEHVTGRPVIITLTTGQIHGAVYYSELSPPPGGHGVPLPRLARVTVDAARHELLVPFPPNDGVRVTTQTVTHDGRYLAGELASNAGAVFDLLADLTTNPAPSRFPLTATSPNWEACSFRPDGSQLIVESLDEFGMPLGLGLFDPATGAAITATGLPLPSADGSTYPANPAYAPDGSRVAFVTDSGFDVDGNGIGDLAMLPQTATGAFGTPLVVHHGNELMSAAEAGNADSHPSWSPDGRWVAFEHGNEIPRVIEALAPSAIYLIAPDGGPTTRLDRAMGGATATNAYTPVFSPDHTADTGTSTLYWVVFTSSRDYGNDSAGTAGTGHTQLWVTAVRTPITPGTDPSSVPYWLPGQSTGNNNIMPTWAPTACLATGTVCTALSQCCTGNCATDPANPGQMTCQSNSMCRQRAQTCSASSDCCSGLSCTNNVCEIPPPG